VATKGLSAVIWHSDSWHSNRRQLKRRTCLASCICSNMSVFDIRVHSWFGFDSRIRSPHIGDLQVLFALCNGTLLWCSMTCHFAIESTTPGPLVTYCALHMQHTRYTLSAVQSKPAGHNMPLHTPKDQHPATICKRHTALLITLRHSNSMPLLALGARQGPAQFVALE
jgi:hypothetical protein